jgi:hypothetical protein
MQNLFITEEDVLEVKICVAENDGVLYCDIDEKGVKFLLDGIEAEVEEYTTIFRKPSFGDLLELTDILLAPREESKFSYDANPLAVRLKMMGFLIKDWTFTNEDGSKIPATEESIKNLNPLIAAAIGIQLDSLLNSKEEEDKSE